MARRKEITRNQTSAETRQQLQDAAPGESDDEGYVDRTPLPALYVKPEAPYSFFGGTQSVIASLIEMWRRRKSRSS
jgi:hypothetical protein